MPRAASLYTAAVWAACKMSAKEGFSLYMKEITSIYLKNLYLLLNFTNNKVTMITAIKQERQLKIIKSIKGVVVYANHQTRFRFKELQ